MANFSITTNIVDKLSKLIKLGFYVKSFRGDYLRFLAQIQNQFGISRTIGNFLKSTNFLIKSLATLAVTCTFTVL